MSRIPLLALVLAAAFLAGCSDDDDTDAPPPPPEAEQSTETEAEDGPVRSDGDPQVSTVARGLDVPWEIAFLPDGSALITERPGTVRLLSRNGRLRSEPIARIDRAEEIGEGGLLGMALDPEFEANNFVYLYRTTNDGNEVARFRYEGGRLEEEAVIADGIAAAGIHNGGRVRFGPDDRLYFSTGDAANPSTAQDPDSLEGKILRFDEDEYRGDGGRPEVFSFGHRNPQGFDWQPETDRLYEDEHGAAGNDEVNLLRRAANYGWPDVEGGDHGDFTAPLAFYAEAIAPSGATFVSQEGSEWSGDYLIGSLRGEQIRRLTFDGDEVTRNEPLFEGQFGRIRTVIEGPDGALYALTSNTDGRGTPREGDDRLLRIVPPAG